jgi:hypothetical protein
VALAQETEEPPPVAPVDTGPDHEFPLNVRERLEPSTATQKVALGQETESTWLPGSIVFAVDHDVPLKVTA